MCRLALCCCFRDYRSQPSPALLLLTSPSLPTLSSQVNSFAAFLVSIAFALILIVPTIVGNVIVFATTPPLVE